MYYVIWAMAGMLLVFFLIRGIAEDHRLKKKFLKSLVEGYGKPSERKMGPEALDTISHYHLNGIEKGYDGQVIDDITWNDLDMDRIYLSMDFANSQTGEEYLYDMLRKPLKDAERLRERDRVISYFMENQEERLAFQTCFARMGRMKNVAVSDYLKNLDQVAEDSNILHFACIVLAVISIGMVFLHPAAGFGVFFLTLIFNVATYFRRKGQINPYIATFSYLIRAIHSGRELLKVTSTEMAEYREKLKADLNELKVLERNFFLLTTGRQMTGSLLELPLDYLRIFFHLDLIKFNNMLSAVRSHEAAIDEMFGCIGFLDAAISIGAYRASLPYWCLPEEGGKEEGYRAEQLYHPLLKDPVPSDVSTGRGILVTGSNASGKSTFLKAAALSVLFSQTIATAPAKKLRAPYFRIYSSMSIRDDILTGESYYMAEIRSLKRILDEAEKSREPLICFIDEVLRGTNTIERIAASSQILKSLSRPGIVLFAATHDIELTYMLEDYFDNCHFSEDVLENDIRFSYKLEPGRAGSRNAIKLLSMMGYEEGIIHSAQGTAERFAESGSWPKL